MHGYDIDETLLNVKIMTPGSGFQEPLEGPIWSHFPMYFHISRR